MTDKFMSIIFVIFISLLFIIFPPTDAPPCSTFKELLKIFFFYLMFLAQINFNAPTASLSLYMHVTGCILILQLLFTAFAVALPIPSGVFFPVFIVGKCVQPYSSLIAHNSKCTNSL